MTLNRTLLLFTLTTVIALTVSMLPMHGIFVYLVPDWVALVVLWWNLKIPQHINVGIAWICGIVMDVTYGGLLGQHALAIAITSYLAIRVHRQYSLYSVIQQTLLIVLLLIVYRVILFWVSGSTGAAPDPGLFWLPVLSNLLVWPWLHLLLELLSRDNPDRTEDV